MEDENDQYAQLIAWLQERGHSEDEIERILDRVRWYDEKTGVDSVMRYGSSKMKLIWSRLASPRLSSKFSRVPNRYSIPQ